MVFRAKKAQVTVFVIIAILIVASVSVFLYLRVMPTTIPAQFQPLEKYFLQCIENKVKEGTALLGSQAGYIEVPEFEPGSEYMPFSSQMDFFGTAVPYWFYISGNNIMKQQVPTVQNMEKQLANFLNEAIKECDFSEFETKGYNISLGEAKASTTIDENDVRVSINSPLNINYGDTNARITRHELTVQSKIGKFYKISKSIYEKEQQELFLENYSLDVLSLYAPVTGVEMSCSPKVWVKQDIENGLKNALEANIGAIKIKGDYYRLKQGNKYFVKDIGQNINENVNMLYSGTWQTKFEVSPNEGGIMTAKPVGNQQGLGILGFCYVPYHFVYDIAFPVMVQIYDGKEMFQFPVVVQIDKNTARQAKLNEALPEVEAEICNYKNTEFTVYSFDNKLTPIEADIKFKCINSICDIGKTKIYNNSNQAYLISNLPQCINGFVIASAEGYSKEKTMVSTNNPGVAAVMLSKLYNISVDLSVGLAPITKDEQATVSFVSSDYSTSILYPQQKMVQLKEGLYNISVLAFRQGSLTIGEYTSQQCTKVPKTGILGLFGFEEEKCYDINLPSQTLTQIPLGGGKTTIDLLEDDLDSSSRISIDASYAKAPSNILELQDIYSDIELSELSVLLQK